MYSSAGRWSSGPDGVGNLDGFFRSCCVGRIVITKGCFDLVCCKALIYLRIHHLTPQPAINRLLHSSLVLSKLRILIPVNSCGAVGFLHLIDEVFSIVGYNSCGCQASICSKATQDWLHLFLRFVVVTFLSKISAFCSMVWFFDYVP